MAVAELDYINTMLLYINEKPFAEVPTNFPSYDLAKGVLDETVRMYNNTMDDTVTILTADILVVDYIVRRASRSLFTRM